MSHFDVSVLQKLGVYNDSQDEWCGGCYLHADFGPLQKFMICDVDA